MLTEELKKNSTCSAYEQLKYVKEKLRDIHLHYMDSAEAVIKKRHFSAPKVQEAVIWSMLLQFS